MTAHDGIAVEVRTFHLSAPLHPYFTALYLFAVSCPPDLLVEDQLHPEWAAMRFTVSGPPPISCIGAGALEPRWPFVVSGPTSKTIRFGLQDSLIWGLGLQPAGFARYVHGRASDIADRTFNGSRHPAFAPFAPLLGVVLELDVPLGEMAQRIDAFLLALDGPAPPHEEQILACQEALRDPDIANVEELCERVGVTRRSLERLCSRYFGFPPKLLIRRQRFLRSLAQFTVTGGENWSRSLDGQYHDQAHFVRDFRAFMGMTPSEYAARPHPVLDRIMVQRMADQGALPETDLPTLLRYAKPG